ncbi:MAG: phosphotransferase family protein [Dehalococcoidia bacterium]
MDEDTGRNEEIARLAESLYGVRPRVRKLHSENNYVCKLEFDGAVSPKVFKLAGGEHLYSSVRQEATALERLAAAGLAVPRLEHFRDDGPSAPWMTLEFVTDIDLGQAIAGGMSWAEEGCRRAGAFLRDLHRAPLSLVDSFTPQHVAVTTNVSWEHWSLVQAWDSADGETREALIAVAACLNEQLQEPPVTVVHDSFVANHVLMDGGNAFAVNDWETIGAGYPERDLACFVGALQAWLGGLPDHRDAFLEAYREGATVWAAVERRVAAWEVYYLMNWTAFTLRHNRAEMSQHLIQLTKKSAIAFTR